jgi:hypothetical protein
LKKTLGDGKYIPCSWICRLNIEKTVVVPKLIYRFGAVLFKIPMTFFTEIEKSIQKYIWKYKT